MKSATKKEKLKEFTQISNMVLKSSRVKSCKPCRLAKARCSLGQPCSRCVSRQVKCRYMSEVRSASATSTYRRLESAGTAMPDTPADTEVWGASSSYLASTPQVDSSTTSIFDSSEAPPGSAGSARSRESITSFHPPMIVMTDGKYHRKSRSCDQ